MTDTTLVEDMLNDQAHHIEFNGHLTNHVKHAVVALAGLGASPGKIKAYYDNYARLTPYGYGLEAPKRSKHTITEDNWKHFLGRRTSYGSYCDFFDRRQKELGTDALLQQYLPELLAGWVGAFTHATIHLGWALDIQSRWMTIEGLAYMVFSDVSCHPERAFRSEHLRDTCAQDSLLRIAGEWEKNHAALHAWVEALVADTAVGIAAGIHPELARSGLQYRIARMSAQGHPLIYELPTWIDTQDVTVSWEQLYEVTTLLYLAQPGDFVLLHLITSLHAMEQISLHLPAAQRRDVVRCFWVGILCILFSRGTFPSATTLARLRATYRDAVDGDVLPEGQEDWERIIARAVEEEEEHNPKMVYVLRRVWKRTGRRSLYRIAASHFTTTPELPKTFEEAPHE
ncbi:questin oxidase family protein [Melittangium boletus]|uniref:questin oxidase family protein n=1 Tax=Melittangium boletus TaxID=83453 RepID=UPI003DA64C1D